MLDAAADPGVFDFGEDVEAKSVFGNSVSDSGRVGRGSVVGIAVLLSVHFGAGRTSIILIISLESLYLSMCSFSSTTSISEPSQDTRLTSSTRV